MSPGLLGVAQRVVEWAGPGIDVEAFTARESETEVRSYQGEIESLTVASSQGIGVRVVRDGRSGFAYAATSTTTRCARPSTRRSTTRDSPAKTPTPESPNRRAERRGPGLVQAELVEFAVEDKAALAIELEQATLAADSRVTGVESAEYADSMFETAVANSRGVCATSRETSCHLAAFSLASQRDETQTGFGFSVGRHPGELSVQSAAEDAAERATRLLGAVKAPTRRLTVVFDPYVTAQFLSIVGATLSGEAVLKGRSLFADRLQDAVGAESLTLIEDATEPEASAPQRSTPKGSPPVVWS